jgi:hypothetical protein
MSIERKTSDRRKLRAGMVFVLVVAGTAMIGWGGLAAWQAVTANNGSSFATGDVHMQNVATITYPTTIDAAPVTCADQDLSGNCGAIFTVTGAGPGFSEPVGTVQITNTGTLPSTFVLSLGSAVSSDTGSPLCSDLTLKITDSTGASVYKGALASLGTTPKLYNSASVPTTTWNQKDTNTFTFTLALPGSTSTDQEDSTCTADFTWRQTQAA